MEAKSEPLADLSATQRLECDIVMAGGVTSGIIYPGAVATIARRYSFRSIGGTSVGAIAAAITAAAEYGRQTNANPQAFEQIADLPLTLSEVAEDGHSRLFHLFTPEPSTKPLTVLGAPLLTGGSASARVIRLFAVGLSFWQVTVPTVLALLVGLGVAGALFVSSHLVLSLFALLMAIATAVLVWTAVVLLLLARRWLPALRENGYGLCTGQNSPKVGTPAGVAKFEGLADWMHARVQAAAGRELTDPPLTFGELWSLAPASAAPASPTAPRAIELVMITSDISRNRTAQLPFLETPSHLYVERAVLERYFPTSIQAWIIEKAGEYDERVEPRAGVTRLPRPENLPVVFAARLSSSFPILLSAVPLMTPDYAKADSDKGHIPLRQVWYSDGGLTSNFPIHFFDSPIPARPTFCLNLVDFQMEAPIIETSNGHVEQRPLNVSNSGKPITKARAASRTAAARPEATPAEDPAPEDPVWGFVSMPHGNSFYTAPFSAFDTSAGHGLASFFFALVNTARFWSDNQLLITPGVRDRVVNIALREDEGGLTLDMDPRVVADLDRRGRAAGLLISARFDPEQQSDPETGRPNEQIFASHRWVRFRNFMASFEDASRRFAGSRRAADAAAAMRGESRLDDMLVSTATEKLDYPAPKQAQAYFTKVTNDLDQLALAMAAATRADANATFDRPRNGGVRQPGSASGGAPRPKMRFRMRPLVDNDPRSEAADLPIDRGVASAVDRTP